MKKQLALALTAGVAATGAVVASAATLGGVDAKSLGADTAVIASCQKTGKITVDYTTSYNEATADYSVSTVTISNIDMTNCVNQYYTVVLSKPGSTEGTFAKAGTFNGQLTAAANGNGTIVLSPSSLAASDLTKISILITTNGSARPSNA